MDRTMREHFRRSRDEAAQLLVQLSEEVRQGRVSMFGFELRVPPEAEMVFELHPDPPNERLRVEVTLAGASHEVTASAPSLEAELSRPGG